MPIDDLAAVVYTALTGDATIAATLSAISGSPSIFEDQAPDEVATKGEVYIIFTVRDSMDGVSAEYPLKRMGNVTLRIIDFSGAGRSMTKVKTVARRIVEIFDFANFTSVTYVGLRFRLGSQGSMPRPIDEESRIEYVVDLSFTGHRQYLADIL